MNKFYIFSEWISKLLYLQFLWVIGTLVGGIVIGIFPATIALYASIRQLYLGETDLKVAQYFKEHYKKNFKDSLIIGSWYILTFIILFIYMQFISATSDSPLAYLHIILYIIMIAFILLALYIIPVFVHYDVKLRIVIKNAFFISLINIKYNIYLISSFLALFLILSRYQIIIIFFGISLPAFLNMFFCMKAFNHYSEKRNKYVSS